MNETVTTEIKSDIKSDIKKLQKIIDIGHSLKIPDYQRPYVWSERSVKMLFNDTYEAYRENLEEYRLGTLIFHNNDGEYNIVDGQQRLITIALLLYKLGSSKNFLLNEEINNASIESIKRNIVILEDMKKARFSENNHEEDKQKQEYLKYLCEKCTFAVIETKELEDAFQFFDSQNSRGKPLAPHDLLKAYHLREMRDIKKEETENIVNQWENIEDTKLAEFFANYLYPLVQWYQGKDGINYNVNKIDVFKGISEKFHYNFAQYHLYSYIFLEKLKKEYSFISSIEDLELFQLTQPIISGKRFFQYVFYYYDLLKNIEERIDKYHNNKEEIPFYRTGDIYTKRLYTCALLFFVDRFGIKFLEDKHMDIIYKWCYGIRLVMKNVYRETINNYAKIWHYKLPEHYSLFKQLNNMISPNELFNIVLQGIDSNDISERYPQILAKYNIGEK